MVLNCELSKLWDEEDDVQIQQLSGRTKEKQEKRYISRTHDSHDQLDV
jgi:hypothetical protein